MPIEKLKPTFSFDEERIKQLKQIVPEAFADNQINWDLLKEALGDYLEDDQQDVEHFGLFWPGKREARRMASIPSKGTLIPCPGEGIDEENTRNIFIEGENLEVLKILQKSYAGKIKMIYIDPPYNTGNDFVYDDDFTEPLEEYLRRTGQIDEEGKPLTTNKKSDGRFHSKWLSMMYPRLRLARNLLRDDGVIFISIDDNEQHNLRQLMNEIFGEENFVANIIWQSKTGSNDAKTIDTITEYITVFAKNISNVLFFKNISGYNISRYKYKDEYFETRGPYYLDTLDRGGLRYSDKLNYGIKAPDEGLIFPNGRKTFVRDGWTYKWGKEKVKWGIENKFIEIKKQRNGDCEYKVYYKVYLNVDNEGLPLDRGAAYKNLITEIKTSNASLELNSLFNFNVFKYSKPYELILEFLSIIDTSDSIILDFFAGSGATAQAVLELNKNDNGNRKFILVQLPENNDDSNSHKIKFKTIADICKERIRRVINSLKEENYSLTNEIDKIDLGFKSYSLGESNYKLWEDYSGENISDIETLFEKSSTSLKDNWQEINLLTEILLLEVFPLDSKIEEIKEFNKNKVQRVTSYFCEHKLLICLDNKVHSDTINNLQLGDNDIFICLDNAITDEEKVTLSDKGLIKTI